MAAGHDLQEPLRIIKAHTQLLARRRQHSDNPVSGSVLSHIEGGVDKMHALLNDLLAFARVSGEQPVSRELLPLNVALEDAQANLQNAVHECGATIVSSELPVVFASRTQIVQLFQNLIGNAICYRRALRFG